MVKQILSLNKGWNFVGFHVSNINFNNLRNDKRILEIKSVDKTYNSSLPEMFNSLNNIDRGTAYFIKVSEDFNFEVDGKTIDYNKIRKINLTKIINRYELILENKKKILNSENSNLDIEKQLINLNKGWNLVSFYLNDINFKELTEDNRILEIKSGEKSYNKSANEIFNTLTEIEKDIGYFIKVTDNFDLEIKGNCIDYKNISNNELNLITNEIKNDSISIYKSEGIKIPDEEFRRYLNNKYTSDVSGEIIYINPYDVNEINLIDNLQLDNLEGLEHFSEVTYINISNNNIDFKLDLTNLIKLEELYCNNTEISELDVTNNINLKQLCCYGTKISELDITNNTKLIELNCGDTNITELDLTKNTELETLNCQNTNIIELNLGNNINLETIKLPSKLKNLIINDNLLEETQTPNELKDKYIKDFGLSNDFILNIVPSKSSLKVTKKLSKKQKN